MMATLIKMLKFFSVYVLSSILVILSMPGSMIYFVFIIHSIKVSNPTNRRNKWIFKILPNFNQQKVKWYYYSLNLK